MTTNREAKTSNTKGLRFPEKLHMILEGVEARGESNIISWLPNGASFRVHRKDSFSSHILPAYFGTSKYKSFQRNLNLWGFKTAKNRECYHPLFLRRSPELLQCMRREKKKGVENDEASPTLASITAKRNAGNMYVPLPPPPPLPALASPTAGDKKQVAISSQQAEPVVEPAIVAAGSTSGVGNTEPSPAAVYPGRSSTIVPPVQEDRTTSIVKMLLGQIATNNSTSVPPTPLNLLRPPAPARSSLLSLPGFQHQQYVSNVSSSDAMLDLLLLQAQQSLAHTPPTTLISAPPASTGHSSLLDEMIKTRIAQEILKQQTRNAGFV